MEAGAPETDAHKDRQDNADAAVLREHVDSLYRQPLAVLPGGDLLAASAAAFAGYAASEPLLLLCAGLLGLTGFARYAAQRTYRVRAGTLTDAAVRAWHHRYAVLAWWVAALVGALGWLGAHTDVAGIRLLTAYVVFASTTTMVRTGTYPRYVVIQAVLAFAPVIAVWATIHSLVFIAMTLLTLAYLGVIAGMAAGVHRLTFDSLRAVHSQRALVERLEEKNRELQQQDAQLRAQTLRFDTALENMAQGLAMFDNEHRLLVCNHRYIENYRLDPDVVKPGISVTDIISHYRSLNPAYQVEPGRDHESQLRQTSLDKPAIFSRSLGDGRLLDVSYSLMPGGGYVITTTDVTEQRRTHERVDHLARHDPLTGLINRHELPQRLAGVLARVGDGRRNQVAVLALGLDRFKQVNDTLGHPVGDAILKKAAERLRKLVGPDNIVARLGGDEFVCVITDVRSRDAVGVLAGRIAAALGNPYDAPGQRVEISASLGIALAPQDGSDPDRLLRSADVALHRAKAEGRGGCLFFGPDMERSLVERQALERDLRVAMQQGQFELYYQPLVDAATLRVTGCEALLRWNHPRRGLLMPDEFIGLAEESGVIVGIGEWVLRTACREAAAWPDAIKIAVNVSPLQFAGAGLLRSVVSTLAQAPLAAERLEMEITEAVLLSDTEETLATLGKLRELGVKIVMDDFGIGYSSLNYLRQFPFDKIKIDRSFVTSCRNRSESETIIQAVVDMALGLGMTTIAEGIETEEQLRAVRDRGCTEAQGYLFARPMPAADLRRFLMQHDSSSHAA